MSVRIEMYSANPNWVDLVEPFGPEPVAPNENECGCDDLPADVDECEPCTAYREEVEARENDEDAAIREDLSEGQIGLSFCGSEVGVLVGTPEELLATLTEMRRLVEKYQRSNA